LIKEDTLFYLVAQICNDATSFVKSTRAFVTDSINFYQELARVTGCKN
jgi:hypothetical protein